MAAPTMMDSVDPQLAQEMIAEDVEEVQDDQSVMTMPGMMDSVDPQLAQEMITDDVNNVLVRAAAAEDGQEVTVDLLARYMQIEAHDWNNRIRAVILGLVSAVPKVGAAISMLIGFFWPANKVDIWQALNAEQYVRNIVKQEIFEFEMRLYQSDIEALQTTVLRYDRAALNERGNFLSIWITQAHALSIRMRNSTNNIHLLLHIVTVATLHVAALHERLTFGEELYGENNTVNWKKDLVEVFKMYTSDIVPTLFKNWKPWRESQIEIQAWRVRGQSGNLIFRPDVSHATVEDKLSGERITFRVAYHYSTTIFSQICQDHKIRMMNEAIADMASCMSPTFGFHKLLPDDIQAQLPAYDREQFSLVYRGPYSQDLLQPLFTTVKAFRSHTTHFHNTLERISEVVIRAGHHVDALQFLYARMAGPIAGNATGGVRHQFDVRDRPIQEIRMEFSHDILASLQFHFEDGTSTQKFGNTLGWASRIATCTAPSGYMLTSRGFRSDPGPYGTAAISVIRFHFTPEDP